MGKLTIQNPNGGGSVTVDVDKEPTHEDVEYIASQVFGTRQLTGPATAQPYVSKTGEDPFNAGDPAGKVATFEKTGSGLGVRTPVLLQGGVAGTRIKTRSGQVGVFGPDGSAARPDGSPWVVAGGESPAQVAQRQANTDTVTHSVFPSVPRSYWGGAFREAIADNPVRVAGGAIASSLGEAFDQSLQSTGIPGLLGANNPVPTRVGKVVNTIGPGAGNVVSGLVMGGPAALQYVQDNAIALAGNKKAQRAVDEETQGNLNMAGMGPGGQLEAIKQGDWRKAGQITAGVLEEKPIEAGAALLMGAGLLHAGIHMAPEAMVRSLDTLATTQEAASRVAARAGDMPRSRALAQSATKARATSFAIQNRAAPIGAPEGLPPVAGKNLFTNRPGETDIPVNPVAGTYDLSGKPRAIAMKRGAALQTAPEPAFAGAEIRNAPAETATTPAPAPSPLPIPLVSPDPAATSAQAPTDAVATSAHAPTDSVTTDSATPDAAVSNPGQAATKPSPAPDMAASINLDKVSPDADVRQATRDSVDRTGTRKTRVSWDERRKMGKELNMQLDELRKLPVGQLPVDNAGVPVDPSTFKDNVRNIQAHYAAEDSRTFKDYQQAVKENDPRAGDFLKANQAARDAQDIVTPHVSHWAGEYGRGLNEQRSVAEGYAPNESVRVREKLADTPSMADASGPLPEPAMKVRTGKGAQTPGRTYGARNKGVTVEEANAIRARLRAQREANEAQYGQGLRGLVRNIVSDETGAFDTGAAKDLIDLGRFHIEAGARTFAEWLPKMRTELGDHLDTPTAMALYAHTKTAMAAEILRKQRDTAGEVFTDQLAGRFGSRKAVSAFLDQIADADGSHTILDKLIHGKAGDLSPEQKGILEAAYRANTKPAPSRKPAVGVLADVDRLMSEQKAARQAPQGVKTPKAPPTPEEAFGKRLLQGLGEAGRDAFYHDVASDPQAQAALEKLHSGASMTPGELRPLADAYARNQVTTKGRGGAGAYEAFNKAVQEVKKDAAAAERSLPENRLDVNLSRRVGAANVAGFKASLAPRPFGAEALDKLRSGDTALTNDERMAVAEALQDARLPKRQGSGDELAGTMSRIVADARAGRIDYDDPVQRTRKLLTQIAPARSGEITKTLAGIETDAGGKPTAAGYKELLAYKQAVSRDVAKAAFKALSVPEKVGVAVSNVANAARSLTTSFDLSAPGRQGGFLVAANPRMALKSFPDMIRAFADERVATAAAHALESRVNAPLYKKSGLYIAPMDEYGGTLRQLSNHEEAYMSQLAEKIPIIGRGVRGSERAYVTFLNKLRADNFDMFVRDLRRTGREPTEGDLKQIATFVNDATGRGDLGTIGNSAAPLLNTIYFSPRFAWSRARLAVGAPLWQGNGGITSRALIARTYVQAAAGAATVLGLLKLAGADVNVTEPTRSDFLKAKFKGRVIVDPMAGFSQLYTLFARESLGRTTTQAGATVPLDGKGMHGDRMGVLGRYSRSKLSPMAGTAYDLLAGKNYIGEPVTPFGTRAGNYLDGEIARNVVPMSAPDFVAAAQHEGVGPAVGILAANTFGIGANYQQPKPAKPSSGSGGFGKF